MWAGTLAVQMAIRMGARILRHLVSYPSVGLLCCHQVRPDAMAAAMVSIVSWKLRPMAQLSTFKSLVILLFLQ